MEQAFPHPKSTAAEGVVHRFPETAVNVTSAFLRGLPSEATRAVYDRAIRQFSDFHGGEVLKATRRDVEAFRAHLEALGRAPATIAKSMAALTGLFDFAVDEGIVERNPARSARRPKVPSVSPRQGLSTNEVRALLDALDLDTHIGRRDRVLVLLLAVQAWRISEALGLRVEDLGEESGHRVATITGKGSKVCRVPLAATTWQALREWLDATNLDSGPILVPVLKGGRVQPGRAISPQSAWRRIRHLGELAGLSRAIHPHLFRHGAATALLDKGVPLRDVQDHLRHADPRTTRRYDSHRMSLNNQSPHVLASAVGGSPTT
jgi:site-specific recombinase XerD